MAIELPIFPQCVVDGEIVVPGDKSISHRAIILSAISDRETQIENILLGDDVLSTINIMRELGVRIDLDVEKKSAYVFGVGLHGLKQSRNPLNCGNSGTSMRLITGLLSAQKFNSILIGDASLMKRPMLRVAEPLRLMGAKINLSENNTAPIRISGSRSGRKILKAIDYVSAIPSAQVKSAILLAGLYAEGETTVCEKIKTRDHTEKMMRLFHSHSCSQLKIPGDISSAAFFIVLAAMTKNADIIIRQVGVNPFRTGIIDILKLMGANITVFNETLFGLEPVADIRIQYAPLRGIKIPADLVSKAIDEFPAIFIAAVTAKGKTILHNAKELRVKESDRIKTMVNGLRVLGVDVEEYEDGIYIEGPQIFQGGQVDACGDHRVAMAFSIAGNVAKTPVFVDNCEQIKTSFPNFVELANQVGMKICLSYRS